MRIININVNGVNAFANRAEGANSFFSNFQPDIICMQEVKGSIAKLVSSLGKYIGDYYAFVNDSKGKVGYAGVAMLLSKKWVGDRKYAIHADELADLLEVDNPTFRHYCTGRILRLETEEFNLITVYTLNSGNKEVMRILWDELFLKYIMSLPQDKPLIISGDLNVCHTELDMYKWHESLNTSPGLMSFEIEGMNRLMSTANLTDAFRKLNGNQKKYSWFAWNGKGTFPNYGWRLDYYLCNPKAIELVSECGIPYCKVSDHYPIDLQISL